MRVRDVMQIEVVTLSVHDDLALADDIMNLGRVRHLPVVDGDRIVGIVSQRDLFRAGMSSLLEIDPSERRDWLKKLVVRDLMIGDVQTASPDDDVGAAAERMLTKRIGCLPVLEEGRLVGLLSESDCMRYLVRLLDIADVRKHLPELASRD